MYAESPAGPREGRQLAVVHPPIRSRRVNPSPAIQEAPLGARNPRWGQGGTGLGGLGEETSFTNRRWYKKGGPGRKDGKKGPILQELTALVTFPPGLEEIGPRLKGQKFKDYCAHISGEHTGWECIAHGESIDSGSTCSPEAMTRPTRAICVYR